MRTFKILVALVFFYTSTSAQLSFTVPPSACTGNTYTLLAQNSGGASSYSWNVNAGGATVTAVAPGQAFLMFTSSGSYTITLTTNLGSYSTSVMVYATPTINNAQSSNTTCLVSNFPKYSKPIKVVLSGATNYVWFPYMSPPSVPQNSTFDIRPAQSMCYTVTGFVAVCSATLPVCFTVIPQFTATVIGNFEYCEPTAATMSVTGLSSSYGAPYTYSWTESFAEIGTLSNIFTSTVEARPQVATSYTLEVTDSAKCISAPKIVQVSRTLFTSTIENTDTVSRPLFPNPCSAYFVIETANLKVKGLRIFSANGKLVYESKGKVEDKISTQNFAAGHYTIELQTERQVLRKKLVVSH